MKLIKPFVLFFLFLTGIVLFLFTTFFPETKLKTPNLSHFIPDEKEIISIESNHRTRYTKIDFLDSKASASKANEREYELMPYEKLIHASDFENEMRFFYLKLEALTDNDTLLRVIHFGDSQIEGDRISGVLRNKLQGLFGGCGVGFLPVSETMVHRLNVKKEVNGWDKFKVFGQLQKAKHNEYGFTGYVHQLASEASLANISLQKEPRYFKGTHRFEEVSLLYKGLKADSLFTVSDEKTAFFHSTIQQGDVKRSKWFINGFEKKPLLIEMVPDSSVKVYGFSLDCKKGVAVDNVAMRGSSGVEFTKMDKTNLKNQLSLLNVGLVVYQFGVNVIPFVLDDYTFYENMVYQQLRLIRQLVPNASVLVVGVSDMARKEGSQYLSYPNILQVKHAQQMAAKRAGCAFWDLHSVMGGENAIKEWVVASPPLAEKDYTHFNVSGAKLVGEKLFQAIMSDFQSYQKTKFN